MTGWRLKVTSRHGLTVCVNMDLLKTTTKSAFQIWKAVATVVRTVEIEKEVYFVGKDVSEILGYQNGSRDINRHVDEEGRRPAALLQFTER